MKNHKIACRTKYLLDFFFAAVLKANTNRKKKITRKNFPSFSFIVVLVKKENIVAVVLRACGKASQVDTFNQTFLLTVPRTLKFLLLKNFFNLYFLGFFRDRAGILFCYILCFKWILVVAFLLITKFL